MQFYMLWIGCLLTAVASAQSDSLQIDHSIDTKYLEDQFYLGVSYDWLVSKPENMKQHSFSRSFFGGYQRDIPLNKARNIGLAHLIQALYTTWSLSKKPESIRTITSTTEWTSLSNSGGVPPPLTPISFGVFIQDLGPPLPLSLAISWTVLPKTIPSLWNLSRNFSVASMPL